MTYRGTVHNGVVVIKGGTPIPDGTEVQIEPVELASAEASRPELPALFRAAERAKATGTPDLAVNHDHHLCGHPVKCRP